MRVRILRQPPPTYMSGLDVHALLVGRIYNLAAPLASALMLDGYAELYETLSPEEKKEVGGEVSDRVWTADDHAQRWSIPHSPPKNRT